MARKHKVHIDIPVDSNPYIMWQGLHHEEEEETAPPRLSKKEILLMAWGDRIASNSFACAFSVFITTRVFMGLADFLFKLFGGKL